MNEVAPGVHRLVAPLGDGYTCLFLVVGTASAAVVDTGVADSPTAVLAPALAALEVDVSHIVVTHLENLVARELARVLPGRPATFAAPGPR